MVIDRKKVGGTLARGLAESATWQVYLILAIAAFFDQIGYFRNFAENTGLVRLRGRSRRRISMKLADHSPW